MAKGSKKILVLGAGCAGLSAAWRLAKRGFKIGIFEQAPRVGGIAAGTVINGNIFENGPHIFHSIDPEIMRDIKNITKGRLFPVERTIKIKFLDNYFNFPLTIKDILSKLPLRTVISAMISLLFCSVKGMMLKPERENTETVLMRYYGKVLYELFFKSYIEHVWGIGPSEFSAEFARQRIFRLDILKILEEWHSRLKLPKDKKVDANRFIEKVEGEIYTTKRGFSEITDRIAEEIAGLGGKINLNSKVKRIIWDRTGGVKSIIYDRNGEDFLEETEAIISTLPINKMVHMLKPLPEKEVIQAADNLKFRASVFVGMVIGRKKVLDSSFMYFRELSFNRVTDLGYFGIEIFPDYGTILIAEILCDKGDLYWQDEALAKEAVLKDLENEGLISREEVLECHAYRLACAYPMYKLGYEQSLSIITNSVNKIGNFKTIGRQGNFQYANAHVVMRMGYDAADEIASILQR